tara:strand:+ start:4089 stop:5225 length:1137 start_codon:yes stop_codon:yes gene_type:complete
MQKTIYLDYAATTPLREEVKDHMVDLLNGPFGNPSSTHQFGRKSRIIIEECRKFIASSFHCSSSEIVFTSGGTEADNAALLLSVRDLGVERIVLSKIEHHAILHAAEAIQKNYGIELDYVNLHPNGDPNLEHLEELLAKPKKTLVSLMHANNEIGNIIDLQKVSEICRRNNAYFHSDTVQSVGQIPIDLSELDIDFLSVSAHKFYGPKGVGFMYVKNSVKTGALINGGAQERNLRGGTENILGIGGMHKALQLKLENLENENQHLRTLKSYMIEKLNENFGDKVFFNGASGDLDHSLNKILSLSFPTLKNDMLLFTLDLKGIAASGGSACSSGSLQGSHVISALYPDATWPVLRFSFGKDSNLAEIDKVIEVLRDQLG